MTYSVYIITNIVNDKVYIGYSKNAEKRWKGHIKLALSRSCSACKKKHRLHKAIEKHGLENFVFEILERNIETKELACEREKSLIAEFHSYEDPTKGYNMTPGGDGGTTFKGRIHTDEFKLRMSEIQRNRSPEWCANFKRAQQNRSEEWRKNISIAQKNKRPVSELTRAKLREAWERRKANGRVITESGRAKLSAALKGKKCHEKTKRAVSDRRKLMLLKQDVEVAAGRIEISERAHKRYEKRIAERFWETYEFKSEVAVEESRHLLKKLLRKE